MSDATKTGSFEFQFKKEHKLESRKASSAIVRTRYPTRIPVIVERHNDKVPKIDKRKFLVPEDIEFCAFAASIRNRLKLPADEALYYFIQNTLPPSNMLMSQLYKELCDEDGYLYLSYSAESTFG